MQNYDNFKVLRDKAEELLTQVDKKSDNYSLKNIKAIIQELQIHQIELELQNEELRMSQLRLKESEIKYYEFYNNAPIAYVTLNDDEKIIEANIKIGELINLDKRAIISNEFHNFISREYKDKLYFFFNKLRNSDNKMDEEFLLLRTNMEPIWVMISGKHIKEGINQFRLAITDISYQKELENQIMELKK